jgi:hypothetical protein
MSKFEGVDKIEHATYQSWCTMKARCNNPTDRAYKHYGARGITICEKWSDFNNFLADMGVKPEGYTIERLDVNKGYYKENCTWIPKVERAANKQNTLWIEYNGESVCLADLCRERGLRYGTIYARLSRGMEVAKAIGSGNDLRYKSV